MDCRISIRFLGSKFQFFLTPLWVNSFAISSREIFFWYRIAERHEFLRSDLNMELRYMHRHWESASRGGSGSSGEWQRRDSPGTSATSSPEYRRVSENAGYEIWGRKKACKKNGGISWYLDVSILIWCSDCLTFEFWSPTMQFLLQTLNLKA